MTAAAASTPPPVLVVSGVSGVGKTTVGRALAQRLGWPFQEGDALHPPENLRKMRAGQPLDDADRQPWLQAVADWIDRQGRARAPGVITCSALKRGYRDFLRTGRPQLRFLYLRAPQAAVAARLAGRRGHFMPPELLDSQFAAQEEPDRGEADVRTIDVAQHTPEQTVAAALEPLRIRDLIQEIPNHRS